MSKTNSKSKSTTPNVTIQTSDNTESKGSSWYFTKRLILLIIISIILWQVYEGFISGKTNAPTIVNNITKIFGSDEDKGSISAEPKGTIAPGVVTGLLSTVGVSIGLAIIWFIIRRQGTRVFRNEMKKNIENKGEKLRIQREGGGGLRTRFRHFLLRSRFSQKTLDKIYDAMESKGKLSRIEAEKSMKKAWRHDKEVSKSLFGKVEELFGSANYYEDGGSTEKFNEAESF